MCSSMRYTCMPNIKLLSSILQKLWPMLKFVQTNQQTNKQTNRQGKNNMSPSIDWGTFLLETRHANVRHRYPYILLLTKKSTYLENIEVKYPGLKNHVSVYMFAKFHLSTSNTFYLLSKRGHNSRHDSGLSWPFWGAHFVTWIFF